MNKFKKGDLVYCKRLNRYGIVYTIESVNWEADYKLVWCNWCSSLKEAKSFIAQTRIHCTWIQSTSVELVTSKKKEIKPFGIVNFCKKYY